MDSYLAYEAATELSNFVDALSNWYLRRSRQRYWKSELDTDKQDAYATLYESIVTVTNLAAPFVPFMAEEIYQNLVRGPFWDERAESVHLCDYTIADETVIDRKLSEEMAMVRNIVSLGLRVRTDHKLKVRQPLSRAEVVLPDQEQREALSGYSDLIGEELNVHEVVFVGEGQEHVRYLVRPNYRRLGRAWARRCRPQRWPFRRSTQSSCEGNCSRPARLRSSSTEKRLPSRRKTSKCGLKPPSITPPPEIRRPLWFSVVN